MDIDKIKRKKNRSDIAFDKGSTKQFISELVVQKLVIKKQTLQWYDSYLKILETKDAPQTFKQDNLINTLEMK